MAFTDRFVKVKSKLYNSEQKDMLGKKEEDCDMIDIFTRLNPFEIESYRPAIPNEKDFSSDNITCVKLEMKSGETHLLFTTVDDFEKQLNQFGER